MCVNQGDEKSLTKPVLLYDGDCHFCRIWIDYFQILTRGKVQYNSYQRVSHDFHQLSEDERAKSVQLMMPDGERILAARAVFRALAEAGRSHGLWCYQHLFGFASLSEWIYRFIASHRDVFYRLTVFFFGNKITGSRIKLLTIIFLSALAGIGFLIISL